MADRIFIVGIGGSIGQRHARNALALGCEVIGYDVRPATKELLASLRPGCSIITSLEHGFEKKPLGVIVATPPETHFSAAMDFLGASTPLLVEKPLCDSEENAETIMRRFETQEVPLSVGYQLRHTAALRTLKARVDAGEFGTIFSAHAEFSSRQWCRKTYLADFLLETSHELDLLRWFFGDPKDVLVQQRQCELVCGMINFPGVVATIHLDGLSPDYRRRLVLYGTKGTAFWCFDPDRE